MSDLLETRPPAERTRCESCKRLLPDRNGVCPNCINRWGTLRRLLRYLVPYRFKLVALFAVLMISTAAELAVPLSIRQIVDRIVRPGLPLRQLLWLVAPLLAARLVMWLSETGKGRLSAWLGAHVTADLRKSLFDKVVHFP